MISPAIESSHSFSAYPILLGRKSSTYPIGNKNQFETGFGLQCSRACLWYHSPYSRRVLSSLCPTRRLKASMQRLSATPTRSQNSSRHIYVHSSLSSSSHVFLRRDSVRTPLQPPYDGPYKVLSRTPKHYSIDVNGKTEIVSVDRLKAAYLEASNFANIPHDLPSVPTSLSSSNPKVPKRVTIDPIPKTIITRSGRRSIQPDRLNL